MNSASFVFFELAVIVGIMFLWAFALARATQQIIYSLGTGLPIPKKEFWRYVLVCTLMNLTAVLGIWTVSFSDSHINLLLRHHPLYFVNLIITGLISGPLLAVATWSFLSVSLRRISRFQQSNSLAEKPSFWKGPKTRWMTAEERAVYLRKMDYFDYLGALKCSLSVWLGLPFFLLWGYLWVCAPYHSFNTILTSFFNHLIFIEINMLILGFFCGSLSWAWEGLLVWKGWKRTL